MCPQLPDNLQVMLKKALQEIDITEPSNIELVLNRVVTFTFGKGEMLLKPEVVCSRLFFINSGSLIQYTGNGPDRIIIDLHLPGEWAFNPASLIRQKPSLATIEVYEEATISEISIKNIHELIRIDQRFLKFGKILAHAEEKINMFDNGWRPAEKYKYVTEKRPGILQEFPLKLIASYLKPTPETLSRARGKR